MPKLMEVIEFIDNSGEKMVQRIPNQGSGEIKWGAQLTVRESQEAVFFRDGKALDVFKSGRHILETQNIPLISKWVTSFGYGPDSPFRSEVYFVGKQLFPNLKWGTKEPILFRDSELKMIRIRSFGSFSIQIVDSLLFINKIVGTRGVFRNSDIEDYLRNIIISKITGIIGDEISTVFDMPSSFEDLSLVCSVKIKSEFEGLGLSLHDFYINSISVPDSVQELIDERSGMSAVGDMNEFMKYKMALSLEKASENQSITGDMVGGGAGAGMGLGMGFMLPQMIQNSMMMNTQNQSNNSNNVNVESPTQKLKSLKELLDMEIISQEEFELKKSEIMKEL